MSDDPDLQKASYALHVLRQARWSRNKTAAKMVEHLVYVTPNTGLRTAEIEEAHQAAWVAIAESYRVAAPKRITERISRKRRNASSSRHAKHARFAV